MVRVSTFLAAGRRLLGSAALAIVVQPLLCLADGAGEARIGQNAQFAGDTETAIRLFSRSLSEGLTPDDTVAVLISRGAAYTKQGKLDQAIIDFNEAIKMRPDDVDALTDRGNVFGKKGFYEKAILDFNAALHLKPESVNAYLV